MSQLGELVTGIRADRPPARRAPPAGRTPAQGRARYTFLWLAMGGAVVLLGVSHVLWINRQRGVRRHLLKKRSI